MLQAIKQYGESAQVELDTSIVHIDLGTIEFLKVLRRNYILDRLQMQLASNEPEAVQEFYTNQRVLDAQVAQLTYLIEVNNFHQPTEE
jgi:hypothetical protein